MVNRRHTQWAVCSAYNRTTAQCVMAVRHHRHCHRHRRTITEWSRQNYTLTCRNQSAPIHKQTERMHTHTHICKELTHWLALAGVRITISIGARTYGIAATLRTNFSFGDLFRCVFGFCFVSHLVNSIRVKCLHVTYVCAFHCRILKYTFEMKMYFINHHNLLPFKWCELWSCTRMRMKYIRVRLLGTKPFFLSSIILSLFVCYVN